MQFWNSAGELVNPIGIEVMRNKPSGVIKEVRSRLVTAVLRASNPQNKSKTV